MGLFSSDESEECEGGELDHHHEGPFDMLDEVWKTEFKPKKQDEENLYGYAEQNRYAICENCGEKVKYRNRWNSRTFHVLPKDEASKGELEELEIALEELPYL